MKTKERLEVKSWLPVFSGFYNTIWEPRGEEFEIDDINEQRTEKGLKPLENDDSIEWDYKTFQDEVVSGITAMIGGDLKTKGLIKSYELEGLSSPREYNFYNDSIHVKFVLETKHIKKVEQYLKDYSKEFAEYIRNRYSSYDGFCSSYSNDANVWRFGINETLAHEHKLGAVLQFILETEFTKEGADYDLELNYYDNFPDFPFLAAKNYDDLVNGREVDK